MPPSTVTTLYDFAKELLDDCHDALLTTSGGATTYEHVNPGTPSLDCCDSLIVYVNPLGAEPHGGGAAYEEGHQSQRGGRLNVATFKILVTRCLEQPSDGAPLPDADLNAAAQEVDADVWAIWNYLTALYRAGSLFQGACSDVWFVNAIPLEPQGGCIGWTITIRAAIDGYAVTP